MGKFVTLEELKSIRYQLKKEKKSVVFTNGVFDILHRGHVEYLIEAKSLGDVLIVGVNSDGSVQRIKGKNRPIITENDRAFLVSNLSSVDYVCLFSEDTPYHLISALVPDILIKGADWKTEDIVGKDIVEKAGGVVKTISLTPGKSTTSIIDRIIERFSQLRELRK
jgi:D-beta-D-heptose 7-phosphate kinase/D-beta-D-heptose 1-phosphate adenosyltransferase